MSITVYLAYRLLTRHAAISFTRLPDANLYAECLRDGERAAYAANFLSEKRCDGRFKGVTLSIKSHVLSAHLAQTSRDRGFPAYSHDMWLERGLQTEAIRYVRYDSNRYQKLNTEHHRKLNLLFL